MLIERKEETKVKKRGRENLEEDKVLHFFFLSFVIKNQVLCVGWQNEGYVYLFQNFV